MSEPFIGEVRVFSFNFAPKGWATCDGQLMAIAQNQALFSILGTTFGGNGINTFALPDLRGRVPLHPGNAHVQGQMAGEENHTLLSTEIPQHNHALAGFNALAGSADSADQQLASAHNHADQVLINTYAAPGASVQMAGAATGGGSSQPHNNMQPFNVLNFCIALVGIYPSRP